LPFFREFPKPAFVIQKAKSPNHRTPRTMNRLIRFSFLSLAITSLVFTTSGCRRKPKPLTDPNLGGDTVVIPDVSGGYDPGLIGVTPPGEGELLAPRLDGTFAVVPSLEPVYFAYDSATVGGSEAAKIDNAAAYFRQNNAVAVMVEGHTDERGSNDYNLGLGERRAIAIRDALISRGIEAARIQTLSKGEEFPAVMGHDEASWSRNRRGEFLQGQ
jgi:peptidoglycan-associated lipoprotein